MQEYASNFDVGEHVRIFGRIQSREYVKKLSETQTETRIAYEVSVSKTGVCGRILRVDCFII